jgi:CheY-like chemotaxis protein
MEYRILHVEDSPDDVMLTALAFRKAGVQATLEVATDGEAAIANLQKLNPATTPNCVLLDIKLPGVSGLDVLKWMRNDSFLKRVPVVILTSSLLPRDILEAYSLGANSYVSKPPDLESLIALAKTIELYWLKTNVQPPATL